MRAALSISRDEELEVQCFVSLLNDAVSDMFILFLTPGLNRL